jgi:hypothetical protein
MIVRKLVWLFTFAALGLGTLPAAAEDKPAAAPAATATVEQAAVPDAPAAALEWKDYKVKGYRLSLYGGTFSGATYLDLKALSDRTILTPGAADVLGYNGEVLIQSVDTEHYMAPRKQIEPGTAIGGRIGIYLGDDVHLDLVGNYLAGRANTTMLYSREGRSGDGVWDRIEVDADDGFSAYKGGISMMYDARPATFFGVTPTLGFGLGGVINRFSQLEDKTALYLEGNFGLSIEPKQNLQLVARADLSVFAFKVDELGYSNMVGYRNFTIGAAWFFDTVPADVRAKHVSAKKIRR